MTISDIRLSIACTLLCVPALWAAPIDPANPPQGRFNDDWAEIFIAGAKSGFAHSTMSREGDVIHTGTNMKMRIDRAGQAVEFGVIQETTETLDGRPISFSTTMDLSFAKMTTRGTVKEGKVSLVNSQYGMDQTQTYDYPAGAVMIWGGYRETMRRGFKPGTEYSTSMYAPELRSDGPVTAKTRVGDWERFEHRGKSIQGQKVSVTMESPVGSMEMISWVDADGEPLKVKMPVPGIADMEIITTDQQTALSAFVAPEVFMTTVIKAKRPIDRAATARIKYRLTPKSLDGKLDPVPETDMQKPSPVKDRSVEIVVSRQPHGMKPGQVPRRPSREMDEFLSGNLMMNLDDPVLRDLGQRAAAGESEPFALGDKLRRFVTDYVSSKSMNVGFATANEVARTKEGDCSEHATLLAALGRLNGLPSRVIVGLAYAPFFGGQDDIFGYHMWTQFWIDGRWYDFDAALRESECSPARIAFATSSLKDSGLAELSLALLSTIGAIDLDILEVVPVAP